MKKLISVVLALMLAVTSPLFALAEAEGSYPVEWDLTDLFASDEEWQSAYAEAQALTDDFEPMRGTLSTADAVWGVMSKAEEFMRIYNRLNVYAYLSYSLDVTSAEAAGLFAQLNALGVAYTQAVAFIDPEIYALTLEEREAIFGDERFAGVAYAYRNYVDPEAEALSEETSVALAAYGPALSQITTIFDTFINAELPAVPFELDGEIIALDDAAYTDIIYGDYERSVKAEANQTILMRPLGYINTLCAILQAHVASAWAGAQVAEYETSRAAALASADIPVEVYDLMISAAHEGAAELRRYMTLHKEALGLEEQFPFDMGTYASGYECEVSYDTSVDEVRKALSVLGEDYIAKYDALMSAGHVDVYPGETKMGGAYEITTNAGDMPYVLFNFNGLSGDISAIAHELGHAIYELISDESQPFDTAAPTSFTHEIASITNELLYYLYKIDNAASEEEKLYFLEDAIQMFMNTLFYQALYAEFEDGLYKAVEAGGSLDAETLNASYASLLDELRGDAITAYDGYGAQWSLVPHFYQYSYYVYQYATSVCYAAAIAKGIYEGGEEAKDAYFAFLSAGSSASPEELLKLAGVDILSADTYSAAVEYFAEWVDEYEALTK